MERIRITQRFPCLVPLRKKQRCACFYLKMLLDGKHYAENREGEPLKYVEFEARSMLLNEHTGFSMEYQHNKVHNLKLAADTVDHVLIRPGETFSFWRLVRHGEDRETYKDGLTVVDGQVIAQKGGGLCQLSNMLFWLFLHTPLTIVERHAHKKRDFPMPEGSGPPGTDATVSEGWLDLKMKNNTAKTFQILLNFDEKYLNGKILADQEPDYSYGIAARNLRYSKREGKIYENCFIFKEKTELSGGRVSEDAFLYSNTCEIGYEPEKI